MEARALAGLLARLSKSGEIITSPEKANHLKDFLECRTPAKGGRVLRCPDCGTHAVLYNACNRRGCPVCSRKNQLAWQERIRRRMLPVAHHHLVFCFPQAFTDKWLLHPKATVAELFHAVGSVIRKLEKQRKLTMGTLIVFQSHCQGLAYKAHLHCLITDGALDQDGRWQKLGTLPLAEMTNWVKTFLDGSDQQKGWSIHESHHQNGAEALVQYLGQRLNGSPLAAKDIIEHNGRVDIKARGGTVELPITTFALRYLNHIPEKGTVLVRNCGLYSNRQKKRLEVARGQLGQELKPTPPNWEEQCPRCKAKMETIMMTLIKPLVFDHQRLGFGVDPPEHRELSKAS